ncbi:MAG: type II toxin-antitoxin system PemK/MazF family toxin [Propionibacteriaceae bacterium]|jgi:hypothetical protein|nr:type II toxin-antitoxin system PemK/MazF family toxin [Propionibacteriaceae bacterium]
MSRLGDFLAGVLRGFAGARRPGEPRPAPSVGRPAGSVSRVAGPTISYSPHPGPTPDPGEVVWAYVPYEDDPAQGKVRPVLLLGPHGKDFWSVYFSSVDHDLDEAQEAREGRYWVKVGRGSWDKHGRVSYARVDRLLTTRADRIDSRAEVLDKPRFDAVAAGVRAHRER